MKNKPIRILVATPGRLIDLQNNLWTKFKVLQCVMEGIDIEIATTRSVQHEFFLYEVE